MSTMEGSLSKWTNVVNGWQYRWFVLDDNAGLLSYYTSKEKMMRGARRGCVRLRGAVIGIDDEDDSTFTITTSSSKDDSKTFHFQTRNGEERERWVRALEDTILRHSHTRWDPKKSLPKQDFDRKVAEADAYLQILIDQMKIIEIKAQSLKEEDIEKSQRYSTILTHADAVLNSIKHTIVQLQIAKNTAIPVNGIYQGPDPNTSNKSSSIDTALTKPTLSYVTVKEPESVVQTGIELGSECLEPRVSSTLSSTNVTSRNLSVPEFSYSSSDEDEDYFDAADEISTPSSTQILCQRESHTQPTDNSQTIQKIVNTGEIRKQPSNIKAPTKVDGSLDYDALYEEESEPEMDSMETHGSVISHLLSQVKIGMDLTKVVLPTFILERRSLLEMYADYFAHPKLFVSIADMTTPKDRMIQVVRWYLSSFHAGRKSGVAKKPYNPILGEIFRCHWDVQLDDKTNKENKDGLNTKLNTIVSSSSHSSDSTSNFPNSSNSSPVPWCTDDQLCFIAEQVSHHPPVSAFYAEHRRKKISFNAHIWTKSKFLGLSIGVHNIGRGWINLLEYDEEYVLTFPNGYGRSILTIPWIELGGSTMITCAQTGYQANIEFLTKPFYGGKRNRITCQVMQPGEKKPFLVISGEWSGVMEAKYHDGQTELFANVGEIPVVKKIVKSVNEQADDESRMVWRDVTVGLKINDMDKATAAKCLIEQKQRDEARIRKESNSTWKTKYFNDTNDGGWIYHAPLAERLATTTN